MSLPISRFPEAAGRSFGLTGDVGGRRRLYPLYPGTNSLGSSPDNDLVLAKGGVSRRHLLLHVGSDGLEVEDLRSKNGTFVDGRRIGRTPVFPGDRIGVGPVELRVEELPAGDGAIAIPGVGSGEAPPPGRVEELEEPTAHLPSFAPPVLRRWLAALDRSLDLLEPGTAPTGPHRVLAAVVHELGAAAGCLLEIRDDVEQVVAAAGALPGGGLVETVREVLGQAVSGRGAVGFVLRDEPVPAAIWVEERDGAGQALGLSGDLPVREESEALLRMLLRILGRGRAGAVGDGGPAAGATGEPRVSFPPGYVVSRAPAMRRLYRRLADVARSEDPVLLTGETGTGKEPLARVLHRSSLRSGGPLVVVNCAAIPDDLLEAELFGVARGAATGVTARPGHFLAARGGTLVLDEIGELPAGLQAKLLRAIENREIPRLGGGVERSDARLVAVTNRGLGERAGRGAFRPDLYYRIATHELRVPPLRDRREDVPALVERFLGQAAKERNRSVAGLTTGALDLLVSYPWPGNVRELENEVRRLVAASPEGGLIDSRMLSATIREAGGRVAAARSGDGEDGRSLPERIADLERRAIAAALVEAEGNRTRTAELLGIHRNSLSAKIRRLGIDPGALPDG